MDNFDVPLSPTRAEILQKRPRVLKNISQIFFDFRFRNQTELHQENPFSLEKTHLSFAILTVLISEQNLEKWHRNAIWPKREGYSEMSHEIYPNYHISSQERGFGINCDTLLYTNKPNYLKF